MSTIELAAVLAGAVMALARLFRVAAPLWKYGPPWVQALVPIAPLMLTQIGDMLGAVHTTLDLASVLLFAVLTIAAAVGDARKGAGAAAAALLVFIGLSTTACSGAREALTPDVSARDSYRSALTACELYEHSPAAARTPEADKACEELKAVCK
jgi:hypothetical protein